jgi:AraC-like DNA-binding protein
MYIGIVQNGIFGKNYLLIQDDQEGLNSLNSIKVTQQLDIASVEELNEFSVDLGWDAVYSQLDSVDYAGKYREGISDSLIVTSEGLPAALSIKTGGMPGHIALALCSSSEPATVNGQNICSDRFFMASPGADIMFVTRAPGDLSVALIPESEFEARMGESCSNIKTEVAGSQVYVSNVNQNTKSFAGWFQDWSSPPFYQDRTGHAGSAYHLDECVTHALHEIAESVELNDSRTASVERSPREIAGLIDYFHAHPTEIFSVQKMMQLTGLRRRNLFYSFKEYAGYTPGQYFGRIRLACFRKELVAETRSLTQLALKYNFSHLGDFSAFYKSVYGELPSETRRKTPPHTGEKKKKARKAREKVGVRVNPLF